MRWFLVLSGFGGFIGLGAILAYIVEKQHRVVVPRGVFRHQMVLPETGDPKLTALVSTVKCFGGSWGHAISLSPDGESYQLAKTKFELSPDGELKLSGFNALMAAWQPRRQTSIAVGALAHLELLVSGLNGSGQVVHWYDRTTGFLLDSTKTLNFSNEPKLGYLSLHADVLHPIESRITVELEPGQWEVFDLPELGFGPLQNSQCSNLFDLHVPILKSNPASLQRRVAALTQLRISSSAVIVPWSEEPAEYRWFTVRQLFREVQAHDPQGGLFVDSSVWKMERRNEWRLVQMVGRSFERLMGK